MPSQLLVAATHAAIIAQQKTRHRDILRREESEHTQNTFQATVIGVDLEGRHVVSVNGGQAKGLALTDKSLPVGTVVQYYRHYGDPIGFIDG
jgi:hypothetical protein